MNGHYTIAIDGPSGAGKSSLAKRLAAAYGFIYLDTGAMYRTVGLAAYRRNIPSKDHEAVVAILPEIKMELRYDEQGAQRMYLNGEDVSSEIRTPPISIYASDVSAMPEVRAFLMESQRSMARENDVIMDGRDIGTVVLPDAELKIFLTAADTVRAQRRYLELQEKGSDASYEEVLKDIRYRDEQDSSRAAAPLKPAEDAVHVDTSEIGFDESYELLASLVDERFGIKR